MIQPFFKVWEFFLLHKFVFHFTFSCFDSIILLIKRVYKPFHTNSPVTGSPFFDSQPPHIVPCHFLFLIISLVILFSFFVVKLQANLIISVKLGQFSFHKLRFVFFNFCYFFLLLNFEFARGPEFDSSKFLLDLLLEPKCRKNQIRDHGGTIWKILEINFVSPRKLV